MTHPIEMPPVDGGNADHQTGAGAPIVALDRLCKSFGGFRAVDDLSFSVHQREIFGFLGPNGAGKTTTLRMLLDIIQPTSGRLTILGAEGAIPVRRRIGYLPEERGLYRKMRAAQTIAYFGQLRGLSGREARRRAHALLEEFGLAPFARSRNEALSKGMAQKVQLLATLVHEPDLLILDEPFSGLDPINQHTLEVLIRSLRDQGRTIIFSTHVMEHAERLCDRFLILARGQKQFEGTLAEARDLFPPRLIIRTADPVDPLRQVPGVLSIDPREARGDQTGSPEYEVVLERNTDIQTILRAAFEMGLRLERFEQANTSLHDIFVKIAGDGQHSDLAHQSSLHNGEAA